MAAKLPDDAEAPADDQRLPVPSSGAGSSGTEDSGAIDSGGISGAGSSDKERAHDQQVDADERPLLAHLLELRRRILRSLLFVLVGFLPVYYFIDEVFDFVSSPLRAQLPGSMIATQVAAPFLTPFKLAIYTTIFLTVPLLLHQAWGFVSPGLYLREKRFAAPLLVSSTVLFYLGMAFAYFAVFPLVFQFFVFISGDLTGVAMMTDINHYLDFVLKMFFAFGVAFEIPVATVLLVMTGLTTAGALAGKRPYVIVGCFVMAMLLTPPDVISQILLAVPTWLLFEVGVLLARFVEKSRAEED